METADKFERIRLDVAGYGVTITSWYDSSTQAWRANAPALLHLMNGEEQSTIMGTTREIAIKAMQTHLATQFRSGNPGSRP